MEALLTIAIWIGLCILISRAGKEREIGDGTAFFISLLFSPLIGLIAVLISKRKPTRADYENWLIKNKELRKEGIITNEEYFKREDNIRFEMKKQFNVDIPSSINREQPTN